MTVEQRRDLMEIVDDRASTIVTSQVPVELWHEHIGNPTIAGALLDRSVHARDTHHYPAGFDRNRWLVSIGVDRNGSPALP